MYQATELWDLEFFRKYIPTLIIQLDNVDASFQILVVSLSQLHNRLSSILVQEPPRFAMLMAQKLYDKIRSFTQHLHIKNKMEMIRLSQMLKEFKGCRFDLSQYFQDHQQKTKQAEQKVQKISNEIQKFIKYKQSMQENTRRHECKYYRTQQPFQNFQSTEQRNKERYFQQKLKQLTMQAKQSKIQLQNCCMEQNFIIRNCLQKINNCADQIMKYRCNKVQNFQTFNRKDSHPQINNNQNQKQVSTEEHVNQFPNSDELNKIVEETESNCQFDAYAKIKQRKSAKILEAAVLAESKDELDYRADIQKASEDEKYKRKTYN